jgi:divalent metal cation (Fe/Co/Zn/Cd) transporter
MLATTIREVLMAAPGVQSVGTVEILESAGGAPVVIARLGFGPSTSVADVVLISSAARAAVRSQSPEVVDVVLEPEIAAPRDDANPPTDIFVIRGAD